MLSTLFLLDGLEPIDNLPSATCGVTFLKYFINSSGGFDNKAKRSDTYIVYANGDVARTKKFLFFNLYPKAEPGSEVIVPKKPLKNPIAANQLLSFTTGLATLILAINQIN